MQLPLKTMELPGQASGMMVIEVELEDEELLMEELVVVVMVVTEVVVVRVRAHCRLELKE